MHKWQKQMWHRTIRELKRNFSPGVPVEVRSTRDIDLHGDCDGVVRLRRLEGVVIRVASNICFDLRVDSLVHEWAHAMEWPCWWECPSRKVHGETWGVWYAKIYSFIHDRECNA